MTIIGWSGGRPASSETIEFERDTASAKWAIDNVDGTRFERFGTIKVTVVLIYSGQVSFSVAL